MTALVEFLLARIAEDEALARAEQDERVRAQQDMYRDGRVPAIHVNPWDWGPGDPARVLAECEAKRRIVEHCAESIAAWDEDQPEPGDIQWHEQDPGAVASVVTDLERVLAFLALPLADHPDYREEWKPS